MFYFLAFNREEYFDYNDVGHRSGDSIGTDKKAAV
jgi:hypothetical protein